MFIRSITAGAAFAMLASIAAADFTGPAPLSWRWQQSALVAPTGIPVVDGNRVFIAVGNRVYALDKDTGNQIWRYPAGAGIDGQFRSGPLMTDGMIVAAGDNKTVYAIDAATGALKWQHLSPTPILGQPVVAGKFLVFIQSDRTINALSLADGNAAWAAPMRVHDGILGNLGAHEGNFMYFTNGGELIALSPVNTTRPVWKQRFSQIGPDAMPVVFGDTVFVTSGPYLVAMNALTGSGRWQANLNEPLAYSPAASSEGVMAVTREGNAYFFDTTGRRINREAIKLGSLPAVRPSGVGRLFVAPTTNGQISLFDPKTGSLLWSYIIRPIGNPTITAGNQTRRIVAIPASGPATVAGDTLLVLAQDGSLLAFDKNSGVDLTAPSVSMVWPNAGDQVAGAPILEVIFKIDDEASGVKASTIAIDVDGVPLEFEYGREGFAQLRFSSLSKNKPLMDGRKVFNVTVSDWMGNTSKTSYALTIDNTLKPLPRPTGGEIPPGAGGPAGGGPAGGGPGRGSGGGGLGGGGSIGG